MHVSRNNKNTSKLVTKKSRVQQNMNYAGLTTAVLERFEKDLHTITTKRSKNRRMLIQSVRNSVEMHCTFLVNKILTLENELLQCDQNGMAALTKQNRLLQQENAEHLVWKDRYRKHIAELRTEIEALQKKVNGTDSVQNSDQLP